MIGPSVKLSAVYTPEALRGTFKFPVSGNADKWCRLFPNVTSSNNMCEFGGDQSLSASIDEINLHIRPGAIVVTQDAIKNNVTTTTDLQNVRLDFNVHISHVTSKAQGFVVQEGEAETTQRGS